MLNGPPANVPTPNEALRRTMPAGVSAGIWPSGGSTTNEVYPNVRTPNSLRRTVSWLTARSREASSPPARRANSSGVSDSRPA